MITFTVEDRDGATAPIEVPEGISLSLMEVLKGSDYNIMATCGGMALCATCRVQVVKGMEQLPPISDAELDILDTLPIVDDTLRLSCQLRVDERLDGCYFRIPAED
ncbi:2Fe-2S iron-sulfur cluster-binding protein [Mucilaginibacter sp.]|uniref:2Fe-2S iron-sulfur cluster-binding protein n=1 Tax=Mucilaginibacter sp. TaxID=1882438 RepID=UPI003266273A